MQCSFDSRLTHSSTQQLPLSCGSDLPYFEVVVVCVCSSLPWVRHLTVVRLAYDGDFSETQLVARVNADLADTLGNLLSRCTAPKILPSGAISCEPSNLRLGERERSILEDLQAVRHFFFFFLLAAETIARKVLQCASRFFFFCSRLQVRVR